MLNDISKRLYSDTYYLDGEDHTQWLDRMTYDRLNPDKLDTFFDRDATKLSRVRDYIKNQWVHPATPISANLGTIKGNPISCFVREVADSRDSIFHNYNEAFWLGSEGTGIGTYWKVRSVGEKIANGTKGTSSGVIPFLKVSDVATLAISQGSTRRSAEAVYMDISDPEIEEFINARKADREPNRYFASLHHAVCISDEFMKAVENREMWQLRSNLDGSIVKEVDAFNLWVSILDVRTRFQGEPYLFFKDNANRNKAELYKQTNSQINLSNLCTEINLHTTEDKANICCLASINLEKYDEFEEEFEQVVKDMLWYLDNIVEVFLERVKDRPEYRRVYKGASEDRPLGLGVMGFHSLLQKKGFPMESIATKSLNEIIFKRMYEAQEQYEAECPFEPCLLAQQHGLKRRNATHFAIAPTLSISNLCNQTSQGIEPTMMNIYSKALKQGTFLIKNPYLDKVLDSYYTPNNDTLDEWKDEIWKQISENNGSVKDLDFMKQADKDVFKTAFEIDQKWLLKLAADRQKYIDQSQSINLFFTSSSSVKDIYDTHVEAWRLGINTLYYQRSLAEARVKSRNERQVISTNSTTSQECVVCQ